MNTQIAILYVLMGGVAGALQVRILGNVETKIGIMGNMLINFLIGLLFTLFFVSIYSLIQYHNPIKFYLDIPLSRVKPWEMSAGLLGIIIVTSIGVAASRIGVSGTLLLFVFAQIIVGVIIDHFGLLGGEAIAISPLKVVSILIISLGMYLFFR